MTQIGQVESLWRYPVKSMRGEQLKEAWLGSAGVEGDRRVAFLSSAAPENFPFLTGRAQERMLLYRPEWSVGGLVVETPDGERLPVDDPRLLELLGAGLVQRPVISLRRMDAAQTDAHPVSLFSVQTVEQLGRELGQSLDKRRFRANIYADFAGVEGFFEDSLVGREILIGETAVIAVIERDPRCKMITLDPDTAAVAPEVIRQVASAHGRCAGVYATVVVEGRIRAGDAISLSE